MQGIRNGLAALAVVMMLMGGGGATAAETVEGAEEEGANTAPRSERLTELPEIVVYSQKIAQDIRKVPTSVVNYSEKDIEDANITEMTDVFMRTPGLSQLKGSRHSPGTILSVRGVISGNSDYANPSVGTFVDGAYISGGYDADLFDVESVEVLRGPQGTLFGGNTLGGAFIVRSKQPTRDWTGRVAAGYGSYNTRTLDAAVGGPLSERLSFRVAGLYRATDGKYENSRNDSYGEGGEDYNYRGQMLFDITDQWSATLNLNGYRYKGNYANLATKQQADDHPYRNFADDDGSSTQDAFGQIFTVAYRGEHFDFTSITNHRRYDSDEEVDMNIAGFYDRFDNISRFRVDAWTQEFRFNSPDPEARFTWMGGLYGAYEEQSTTSRNDQGLTQMMFGAPYTINRRNLGQVDVDVWNAAVYGQASFGLTEKLFASAGLRYDHVTKKLDSKFHQVQSAMWGSMPQGTMYTDAKYRDVEKNFDAVLPKLALEYRITPEVNTYLSVSRGYKPGGFQPFNPQYAGIGYDSEYSWNYEAGLKGRFFEDKLQVNFAVFQIDTEDMQFNTMIEGGTVGSISNAGEVRSRGFEVDLKALPLPGLELFGSASYTDAEIRKVSENVYGTHRGAQVPFVPEFKATVGAQYTFEFGLFLRAENIFSSNYYVDAANTIKQSDFSITNFKVGYEYDDFKVYTYANNVFGEEYYTYGHTDAMAGYDVVRLGSPRTFGVMVECNF